MSDGANPTDRIGLIKAVTTPLGFFVLTMLVVEALLGGMAWQFSVQRPTLVWAIIVIVVLLILIVCGFTIWNLGGLLGENPWQSHLANQMADDLYLSLSGAISNLTPIEQEEAWQTVVAVITSHSESSVAYNKFCATLGARLLQRTKIYSQGAPRGVMKA